MMAPILSPTGCGATVLRARRRRLCKTIHPGGAMVGYDDARIFDFRPEPLADLAGLHALLHDLAGRSDCAVIRGEPINLEALHRQRRLLHPDPETGEVATLREVPRRWVALDVDGLPLPAGTDPRDLAACARAVLPRLPAAFQRAACMVQATASHGIKPGARLRLWHWLSRPASGVELAVWLATAPVDPCVFRAVQVIYTAAPIIAGGTSDPLPFRLLLLPGEREAVQVPPATMLASVRQAPRPLPPPREDGSRYGTAALSRASAAIRTGASARHPLAVREALGMARLIRAGLLSEAEVQRAFADALDVPGRNAGKHEAAKLVAWGLAHADARALPEGVR